MNLPDLKRFSSDKIRNEGGGKDSSKFVLVYTGLLSERNGLDIAIEAVHLLRESMPDLYLYIYGHGPHISHLRATSSKYGLSEHVVIKNAVPPGDVPSILSHCDVGISPHRENSFSRLMFSVKVAEYLTIGLPVISARTATMEQYFDDSIIFYFEPGNARDFAEKVSLLRNRSDLVRAKKEAAQEKLSRLNWNEEKKKFIGFIESWGNGS
jgi:glycosyltransferase involved in cell wall biosynthesis